MKTLDANYLSMVINTVKLLPIITHIFILVNILESLLIPGLTNYIYPYIGYSIAYVFLLWLLSHMFRFCSWHRLLIYNMSIHVLVEWLAVNFNISIIVNNFVNISLFIFSVFSLIATISFFKNGVMDPDSPFINYKK